MILIGRKKVAEFGNRHPLSRKPLRAWEEVIKKTSFSSFNRLKQTFPTADYVYHWYTIFDISGNKYRLITKVDYLNQIVNIKCVWTHAEYSMKKNIEAMRGGRL